MLLSSHIRLAEPVARNTVAMEQRQVSQSVGAVVRALRESKGMTQVALEKASGVPQRTISRVEGARKEGYLPQPHILRGLARGLGVSVSYLLESAGYDLSDDGLREESIDYILSDAPV